MVISSLVVETLPQKTAEVSLALVATAGVEVHETVDNKLVVTIEAETVNDSEAIASGFMEIEGVMGVSLIYCNFEDDPTVYGRFA